MKTVLCFGDSNTWGADPVVQGNRFDRDVRWPGVLRAALGDDFLVIEEGLNGRTTVWDDPIEGYKNGKEYLIPCLQTHKPLDLVIVMLGTNDLKMRFSVPAYDIASSAGVLIDIIQRSQTGLGDSDPKALLIAPPPILEVGDFAAMFERGTEKSLQFAEQYQRVANEFGCAFLNAGNVIKSSPADGIHFEPAEHRKLGEAVAAQVKAILG